MKCQFASFAVVTFLSGFSALAATWTGDGGDGLWSNASNWDGLQKPTDASNVEISGRYQGEIIVDEDCAFVQFIVNGGANCVFTGSGKLSASYDGRGALYLNSGSKVIFDGPSFAVTVEGGGWNIRENASVEFRSGDFLFGASGPCTVSGEVLVTGGNVKVNRFAREAGSVLVLDGGSIVCESDNGVQQGMTGFEYRRGNLAIGQYEITDPGYLPKTSDSTLWARSTSENAFDPFGTEAGAVFDMPGTVYVTNSLTASTPTGRNGSRFREVDVGGRGSLYTGRLWVDNAAANGSAHAAHLDIEKLYAKQLSRSTWHSTAEFFNGLTFGTIGGDDAGNSGLALRFHGLLDVDTADPFTGEKLTRTLAGPTTLVSSPSLRVRGGGAFVASLNDVPLMGFVEVQEGTALKIANDANALRLRVGKLTLGPKATLRLEGGVPRFESVFSAAAIDATATVEVRINGSPEANHRYVLLDCGPGGDASAVRLVVEGVPEGWEVRKVAQFAYLADADVTPTEEGHWTGAGDVGNWNDKANWVNGVVPGQNSSPAFTVSTNNVITNDTGARLDLDAMVFDEGSGPCVFRGSPYRGSKPWVNSSSSAFLLRPSNRGGIVYEAQVDFVSASTLFSGATYGYFGFYGGVTSPNSQYVFGGDTRLGGTCSLKSIEPYDTYKSGYATELTLIDGADVEVTNQDTNFIRVARFNVAPTAKLRFTGGAYNATANATITSTVLGEFDIAVPFSTSKAQSFYGTGSVRLASTKSHADGDGVVRLGDGVTLYSDGFSTVTEDAPANVLKVILESDATLGAKMDWTYGPAAGVTTSTTAADRALTTDGIYANLTIDTENPETGIGHKITFADPILAKGDVTKIGAGMLVFDTTGNTVARRFTVEEGTLALGPTLAANKDWTNVLTAREFVGVDGCVADRFKMRVVVNDDGTSTLQMRPKIGLVLLFR